jgi:hypothetical protein
MGKRIKLKRGLHSLCVIRIEKDERAYGLFNNMSWVDGAYVPLGLVVAGAGFSSILLSFHLILRVGSAVVEWVTGKDFCECTPTRFSLLEQFGILLACYALTSFAYAMLNALGRSDAVKRRHQTDKKRRLGKPDFIFDIKTANYLGVAG